MNDGMATSRPPHPGKLDGPASDGAGTGILATRKSGHFDEAYYRANSLDLPPGVDAIRHFPERGAGEGGQPYREGEAPERAAAAAALEAKS
jgi:hypothetical protein